MLWYIISSIAGSRISDQSPILATPSIGPPTLKKVKLSQEITTKPKNLVFLLILRLFQNILLLAVQLLFNNMGRIPSVNLYII